MQPNDAGRHQPENERRRWRHVLDRVPVPPSPPPAMTRRERPFVLAAGLLTLLGAFTIGTASRRPTAPELRTAGPEVRSATERAEAPAPTPFARELRRLDQQIASAEQ